MIHCLLHIPLSPNAIMMTRLQPKGIIFDLDGTLIDSGPAVCKILNEMRQSRSLPEIPCDSIKSVISVGGEEMISRALNIPQYQATEALAYFRHTYLHTPVAQSSIYPMVTLMLNIMKKSGKKLCISTNKPRNLAEKILKELNLAQHFDFINAGGDLPNKKPHPSNIYVCLNTLQLKPDEMVLVGDSRVDQQTALNAGIPFYFFSNGYDDGVDRAKAVFCFRHYSELITHLDIQ